MQKKYGFFWKNLILFLFPLLIPLLTLGLFSNTITKNYVEHEIKNNNFNILHQTKNNLELILNELDSLNLKLGIDPEITVGLKKILNNPEHRLSLEDYRLLNTVISFINAPTNAQPYIQSIYVYYNNTQNRFVASGVGLKEFGNFYDTDWYNSYQKNSHQVFWTEPRDIYPYSFKEEPTKILSIYRNLYSPGFTGKMGVIVLNIYLDYLENLFNNLEIAPGQEILIVDENNKVIFRHFKGSHIQEASFLPFLNNQAQLFEFPLADKMYVAMQLPAEKYHLRYFFITPKDVFYTVPIRLRKITLFLLFVSFFLGLALTYWLTRRNYNQVKNIISIINSAESGRPLPAPPSNISDEYAYISYNLLKAFIEQSFLKIQLSERKYRLRYMEILALQSQINPHFLFNTLETIKWKCIELSQQPNGASRMIEKLSDILQYSLESPGKKVTLREEIANTRSYVDIQKIRYKDMFDVVWEYDEDILDCQTIRLILQPLIENSIYHGFKEKGGKSRMKLKFSQNEDHLCITVIDNGLGMTQEKLRLLREELKTDREKTNHIGLYNTNKRLVLSYGPEYGLKIRSKRNLGTVIYIRIPCPASQG